MEAWTPGDTPHTNLGESLHGCWQPDGLVGVGGPVADPDSLPRAIGKLAFRQRIATETMENRYKAMAVLRDLPNHCPGTTPAVQAALLMLRTCILPKATHLLRALPPDILEHVATRFDAEVLRTFQDLMQYTVPLTPGWRSPGPNADQTWRQWPTCYR